MRFVDRSQINKRMPGRKSCSKKTGAIHLPIAKGRLSRPDQNKRFCGGGSFF
jgi:hypothetical protein